MPANRLPASPARQATLAKLRPSRIESVLHRIAVSPHGSLGLVVRAGEDASLSRPGDLPPEVVAAFDTSFVSGLVMLASSRWQSLVAAWPAEFPYFRDYARQYFTALCRQYSPSVKKWSAIAPPDQATAEELLQSAPPMLGLEYLSPSRLQELWQELDTHTRSAARQHAEGLAGYLKSLDPDWNLIGRVTLHLAENKKNPAAPFAFMATYTQGQTKDGTPQHLPLSDALRQSITAKDATKLDQLLEPVSRAARSCKLVDRLLESRKLFTPQAWGIGQAYEFLSSIPAMEQAGIVVRVPNWWNASRPPRPQVSVKLGSKAPSRFGVDGLDLQVGVAVDGEPLDAAELSQLLAARERLVLLRGKWIQVDQDQLQSALRHWQDLRKQHLKGVDFLQAMRLLSGASIGDAGDEEDLNRWARVEPGEWLQQTLQALREPSTSNEIDPESVVEATLRHYQIDGVHWLWFATQLGLGVCLADDMGLGKTLQVISLIALRKRHQASTRDDAAPCLIVVPTSLLGNWQREFAKFAPQLRIFVAHRSVSSTEELKRVETDPTKQLADVDAVLVTYGMIRNAAWLRKLTWRLMILDEAQAIKSPNAAQTKAIKNVPANCRMVMTGTPIENHLQDLWSLFDFCSPGLLGSAADFNRFVSSKDEHRRAQRLASLRKLIRPYVLRRMKTDPRIVPDLPAKTEMRVDCGLTAAQVTLYRRVMEDLEDALETAAGIQRRGLVLATLMQLKQICNHPSLYLKRPQFVAKESGKFAELGRLCEGINEKQEKVIVFSQFQSMCEPLSQFLTEVFGRPGLVLTGKTSAKARGKLVNEFQEPFGPPFFVISVKAGGTGLNLTEACHVIHFDRWWNPAVEDQATDRAFRIGQKRNVLVHKFVTSGTLEERIDDLIRSKRQVSRDMFDDSGEVNLTEMSDDQLLRFISLDLTKATST
ncbi:MAG: DEAD/DEAH box helicase [Planctomycetaceae bacterium]|nr:MAG: DEAD/DEAH box helicase [Planctomycetaceae bacterium]